MSKIIKKWRDLPLTVKVSTSYAVCSILQRCLSFITLPLFTRLLTTTQYGQYTVYQSWMGILSIFLTLNLAYGSFSTAMVKFEDDRNTYISSIQGICIVLSAIFLAVYLPFCNFWNQFLQLPTYLVVVMVLEILCSNGVLFWSGKKRFEFKYKSVVTLTLFQSFCSPLLAFILVQLFEQKGYARIIGYSLVTIITGGAVFGLNILRGKKFFVKKYWKYALGFNIPLITYYLSQTVFNQSDRIMISHYCGESDAAMYGVAYNLAMLLTFVLNAINNSYVPWFYGKIKEGKSAENQKTSCGIAILMALMLMAVIWFAPEIIMIMAGKKYASAVGVVPPVAMSLLLLFYSQLFINVEFYYEEKKMLVWASVGSAILNIGLNALLIPKISFVVAGYTTLASYLLFVICNYFAMKRTLKKHQRIDDVYDYKILFFILISFMAIGFFGMALYNFLVVRILITIFVFILLVASRKYLINIVKEIRK